MPETGVFGTVFDSGSVDEAEVRSTKCASHRWLLSGRLLIWHVSTSPCCFGSQLLWRTLKQHPSVCTLVAGK